MAFRHLPLRGVLVRALFVKNHKLNNAIASLKDSLQDRNYGVAQDDINSIYNHRKNSITSTITTLLTVLHHRRSAPSLYQSAISKLIQIGEETEPYLYSALCHPEPAVREGAWQILQALNTKDALPALLEAQRSGIFQNTALLREALNQACKKDADTTLKLLDDILHKDSKPMRALAAQILGECGDSRAIDSLKFALDDAAQWVRAVAQSSLQKLSETVNS